jgi:hypothetical protein
MSPHEMTSARIKEIIQRYKENLEDPSLSWYHQSYRWQIDEYEAVLKERAENGTYDSAGYRPGDRHETQRTEYQEEIGYHRRQAAAAAGIPLPKGSNA